ncbi:MAG: Tol-Pal system beta propeller repeat protein TolB [Thermoanaerobaculia bacterium]|nr:Tol-Pal system beta propeller repeat protein TolB [Thermoanaerobaculia bacterium]
MPKRTLARAAVLCLVLPCAALAAAHAQQPPEPEITVILDGVQRPKLRLAYPAANGVGGLSGEAREAARELEATLRRDLEASGVFVVQGPEQLSVLRLTGNPDSDAELYRSLGNEHLLETDLKQEGDRLVLEGRLTELRGRGFLLGKRYRGPFDVARRVAHTFADEIVRFFTGEPGIALTQIAFHSTRDGDDRREVYVMDYDGHNQRPLTAHQSLSMYPAWSPDGAQIAYVSYVRGAPGIYLVDLASGKKEALLTDGTLNISPAISPDGRTIAFARTVGRGNSEIFLADRNGGNLRQITRSSGIDTNPAWSPDGRQIAFSSSRGGSPQIYLMGADGSDLRRVTFEGDYNEGAAWDPDGTRIVHATRRGNEFDLAVTDLVTLESRTVTRVGGSHESPSFSPDGRKIAFASGRGNETQIYVLDLASGEVERLTSSGSNLAPAWSGFVQ